MYGNLSLPFFLEYDNMDIFLKMFSRTDPDYFVSSILSEYFCFRFLDTSSLLHHVVLISRHNSKALLLFRIPPAAWLTLQRMPPRDYAADKGLCFVNFSLHKFISIWSGNKLQCKKCCFLCRKDQDLFERILRW